MKILLGMWLLASIAGCMSGNSATIKDAFSAMIEEDARTIRGEIETKDPSALLARPYTRVVEYDYFPESRVFTHKAVVEFHYLDKIRMYQLRKYRFMPSQGLWDRYFKEVRYNLAGKG